MTTLLRSKTFQAVVGIGISVALICWMFLALNWGEVGEAFKQIRPLYVIPVLGLLVVHFVVRAVRWRYLLPELEPRVKTIELLNAIMVGNLATFILPLRTGEFVRPYLLSLRCSHKFTSGFASVILERFFDLAAVLVCFVGIAFIAPDMELWVYNGAMLLTIIIVGIVVFILVGTFFPRPAMRAVGWLLWPCPGPLRSKVSTLALEFLEGAAVLRDARRFVIVVALTALVWFTTFLNFGLQLLLFDLPFNVLLSVSIGVIVALAIAAPSAPGFIGVYHIACIAGFAMFGLSEELGGAYGIVSHVIVYVVCVAYGTYVLTSYGLDLGTLRKAQVKVAEFSDSA